MPQGRQSTFCEAHYFLKYPLLVALLILTKLEKVSLFFHLYNKVSFISLFMYSIKVTHHLKMGALGDTCYVSTMKQGAHEASSGSIKPYNFTWTTTLGASHCWSTLWSLVSGS